MCVCAFVFFCVKFCACVCVCMCVQHKAIIIYAAAWVPAVQVPQKRPVIFNFASDIFCMLIPTLLYLHCQFGVTHR
jgi:hypothetical protein